LFLALALGLIASGVILFFLAREEKPNKPEQEVITLKELSTLWMHWNTEDKNQRATTMDSTTRESQNLPLEQPTQKGKSTKGWQNESIKEFWKKQVVPWGRILESQSALFPILRILGLLDKYGSCPSIVMAQSDQESKDLKDHWHALSGVSLLDHTLRVTNHIIEIYNSHYKDQILRGAYILAGLSHDLGKIPSFREGRAYSLGDHPIISAGILTEVAKGVPYLEQVIGAVKSHHFPRPQDELAEYLQQADKKAREEEMILMRREGDKEKIALDEPIEAEDNTEKKIIPFPHNPSETANLNQSPIRQWLRDNLTEILKRILTYINQPVGFGKWRAISQPNGICYIDPQLLLEQTREVMKEKSIVNITFMDNSLEEKAKILIADALRERGWLCEGVKDGYYGAWWNYDIHGEQRKGYWIPILVDAFGVMPSELERRKQFPIKAITKVELSMEGNKE
jgi:hypothetical protein